MSSDPTQALADRLRDDLTRGEYHPRERLVESELVERYGFPRATVRAALLQLQAEGLIERSPNRGASVRGLSIDEGVELAEVRRELEVLCARDAAARVDDAGRDALRTAMDAMRLAADTGDVRAYRQSSIGFHERIIALSRHTGAFRQLEAIRRHNLQRHFPGAFQDADFSASLEDHLRVGEAVVKGDAGAAGDAMREHLDRVVRILEEHRTTAGTR